MQHTSQHRRSLIHLFSRDGGQQYEQPKLWRERKRQRILSDTAAIADIQSAVDATAEIVAVAGATASRRTRARGDLEEQRDGTAEAN